MARWSGLLSAPASRLSLFTRLVRGALLALYRSQGWQLDPWKAQSRKFIIVGAPHTTNWDFLFFMGATDELGIRPAFMGKHSLFRWPMTRFMREMGGVPIVRSSRNNYVDQMIEVFNARDELMLVVAPEGTRKGAAKWKSGFYHIALGAGVPIVPAWVDHKIKRGGLGPEIALTGDKAADFARIRAWFEEKMPGNPRWDAITAGATDG
ncbi:lysophospholipid acyltransferase family protein [Novosphingobium sp. MW5]|nr:lysophospholipid acyltransferase family protein [Novosphingobium sp. MW5]